MIKTFAQHRVAANLTMIIMTLAGLWALRVMPTQLDPPADWPVVQVEVAWVGASAEDVEALITTPIEAQLRTLNDLSELESQTSNGQTTVTARFAYDADMTTALDQVKQRVANIRNLPPDIEPPVISRFIDMEPVTSLLITSQGTIAELIPVLRGMERDLLARGIEGVEYDGLPQEEIALLVGGKRLKELGLTLDELAEEVARVSQNAPAGTVGRGQSTHQLRSLDQRRDALGFEMLQIRSGDQVIRLNDLADVVRRPQRGQPLITHEGLPAVQMTLWRSTEADAYVAQHVLEDWLEDTRSDLPRGLQLTELGNVWQLLGAQLEMIVKNGLSGLLLVGLTLFLFLNGRVAWWVVVGIPVSFLLGLALFHLVFGYGISIVALIGFIMALGIVVDDAIVVGEDAVTHSQAGSPPLEAAVGAARRLWVPVMTSSLTTLAAFLPLVLIGGPMGQIILTLPTVLLCVIIASLVECFLVLPGHLGASLGRVRPPPPGGWRQRFDGAFFGFRDRRFMPLVRRALDYPGATLCAAIGSVVIAVSLIASQHVGMALVMGFDSESLEAQVEFAAHASEADKRRYLAELENALQTIDTETDQHNLQGWVTRHNLAEFGDERLTGEQYASVIASYAFEESRTLPPRQFVNRWRERISRPPYVEQLVVQVSGGQNGGRPDITLVLRGAERDALKQGAEELTASLAAYPGVTSVIDNLPYGRDQIIFELTPAGRSLGLTADAVGRQLRAAYSGSRVQIFNQNDAELEVRVMLPDAERDDLGLLQQFPIKTSSGPLVPLSSVAVLYQRRGIDIIRHNDAMMAVEVSAHVDPDIANAMAITADLEQTALPGILERHHLTFGLGGKSEQDQILMQTMALGGALTLLLIYLILAWVFASYLWPLAIMMAIPFGFTGAVLGHWITGWDVGAMSLLAFFSLAGIVVNDSIVLISFLKRDLTAGGDLRQALERAVSARFRAVILTSVTTIAGLTPLMFETSTLSFYIAPIAVTLCFGLAVATLLVLIVIPALILLLEGANQRLRGLAVSTVNALRPPPRLAPVIPGKPHSLKDASS